MARFCTWCGAPLEPGARYCGECGARVIESVTLDGSSDAVDKMRGLDIVAGHELPADKTLKLDRDSSGALEPSPEPVRNDGSGEAGVSGKKGIKELFGLSSKKSENAADEGAAVCAEGEEGNNARPDQDASEETVALEEECAQATSPSGPFSVSGTDTLVLPTNTEQKKFALEQPRQKSKALPIMLGIIAVLAVIAVALLVYSSTMNNASTEPAQPLQVSTQSSSEQPSVSEQAKGDAKPVLSDAQPSALTEDEIYASLAAAYEGLEGSGQTQGYSDKIVACVDEFNTYFLDKDMGNRTAAQSRADAVKASIEEDIEGLKAMDIPETSAYAQDAANVIELYECQLGRITSLTDAWALDVQYDIPSEHKDEILAELSKNYVGGHNPYLQRYDELYSSAKPQKK